MQKVTLGTVGSDGKSFLPSRSIDTANDLVAVTVSDTIADPAGPFRAFRIGVQGAVKVTTKAGTTRTYASGTFAVGEQVNLAITRVWSTGTTATGILGYV